MNRCHGLLGPQNGSDLPSALGLVHTGLLLGYLGHQVVVTLAKAVFFSYLGLLGLFGHSGHLGHPGQPCHLGHLGHGHLALLFSHDDLHMLVNLLCLVVMSSNPIADALVWLSYFSPAVELGTLRNIWTSAKSDYDTTSYVLGFSKMWK